MNELLWLGVVELLAPRGVGPRRAGRSISTTVDTPDPIGPLALKIPVATLRS